MARGDVAASIVFGLGHSARDPGKGLDGIEACHSPRKQQVRQAQDWLESRVDDKGWYGNTPHKRTVGSFDPRRESSTTTHLSGRTPNRLAASKQMSGAGFPRGTSSADTTAAKKRSSPTAEVAEVKSQSA